jgi:hypothetical protein
MKLKLFTICLDAMPMITWHLPVFNRLHLDWEWIIAEGVAANVRDTAWCKAIPPRLSIDGTTEYLTSLCSHPRVKVIRKQHWEGKVEMCDACVEHIKDDCILVQVDADELWDAWQLERIVELFANRPDVCVMRFDCVYYVGQNIVTTEPGAYGHKDGEWVRAWRFHPGTKWRSHEPPVLNRREGMLLDVATVNASLCFHHYAYAFRQQVAFKEQYYGYTDAVKHWTRLQMNREWPVKLKDFLPWVDDGARADLLFQ